MIKEVWRDVTGYKNYKISNAGKIFSKSRNKNLVPCLMKKTGYFYVGLHENGKRRNWFIHRLVALNFISNENCKGDVNHKDHNKLNNNIENLEWATRAENSAYRIKGEGKQASKYKGVVYCKQIKRWKAQICKNYKNHHIGCFDSEEEAAIAYNKKAKELFGKFALVNIC